MLRRAALRLVLAGSTSPIGPKVDRWVHARTGHSMPTWLVSKLLGEPYRPPIVLETTGRRSGVARRVVLPWGPADDDDRILVVASNAGSDRDPDWCTNLRADPRAVVERGGVRRSATATIISEPERGQLWAELIERAPLYARYQERTERPIPIVLLALDGSGPGADGSVR